MAVNTLDLWCRNRIGDLYLVLHVDQKQGIRREGLHLYSDIKIDYTQAILGTTIKVMCDLRPLQCNLCFIDCETSFYNSVYASLGYYMQATI